MTNNPFINEKRESLTRFVREQLIGPGAYGYKFGMDGEEDGVDILDVTPGSIYCSGILFPKKTKANEDSCESSSPKERTDGPENNLPRNEDSNGEESSLYDEEDIKQLTQRFPDSFGISCCLRKSVLSADDFSIRLSGRFYTKIDNKSFTKVFVKVDSDDIAQVSNLLSVSTSVPDGDGLSVDVVLGDYFILRDNRLYLLTGDKKTYGLIQGCLNTMEKSFSLAIANEHGDSIQDSGILLSSYKERVFGTLNGIKTNNVDKCRETIRLIEEKETLLSYFRDLMPMLSANSYGFWIARDFNFPLNLSRVNFSMDGPRLTIKPTQENGLKDIPLNDRTGNPVDSENAKLSVWIQLTKDSRDASNENTYLKVLVENTSSPFEENEKRYYSIVTEGVNTKAFFGVKIEILSDYMAPYHLNEEFDSADKEQAQLRFLYRKIEDYGAGHLCSVDWSPKKATRVWSEFLPMHDSPDVDVVPQKVVRIDSSVRTEKLIANTSFLEFKRLSTLSSESDETIKQELSRFVDAYKSWIDNTIITSGSGQESHVGEVRKRCLSDYNRLVDNISLLSQPKAMLSFRLMNTAMFMQLWHSSEDNKQLALQYGEDGNDLDEAFYQNANPEIRRGKGPAAWRPFQLAFILLNLDGIIQSPSDLYWEKRNNLVDLVWFPTGGGKTEAYLGLIAFSILHRRLSNSKGGGTTAIMRYTLRLLATQQFQRALRLILALEQIRKWNHYKIGEEPINIGLFVGAGALPNTWEDSSREKGLKTEGERWNNDQPSKIPFESKVCPWCGAPMRWNEDKKTLTCENVFCAFEEGLPVLLCDELIYATPPSLLFGTVDKFAAIAHKVSEKKNSDSRRLFRFNNLTPDLIIQDELHLLEGPLGSAVGLFENAVDTLSSRPGPNGITVRPKIISSTATTRNTDLQILALYDRNVNVFPKSGLDFDDSFFAFYKRRPDNAEEYDSKRRYIGVLPTGRTAMYTQIRLAACCFTHRALFEAQHQEDLTNQDFIAAADYYYTLISYFNSKKDVGNTDAQFSTEFPKYTRQVFHRVLRHKWLLECFYAQNRSFSNCELTGRLNGAEIVKSLGEVQTKWDPETRIPHYSSNGDFERGTTPPDFVLATNMISVGIDVSRFNLMIVNSMPRNKSEYIQASSRVARDELGIVFTLHNPYRARDLSHFEKFREFHEKMYFYVDPISITPYSPQAIEKYMPAVLAAIIRHEFPALATDMGIKNLDDTKKKQIQERIHAIFSTRMNSIQGNENELLRDLLTDEGLQMIDSFVEKALDEWIDRISLIESFDNPKKNPLYLSLDAYEEEKADTFWSVPYSLRDIAESSVINIKND